VYTGLLFLLLFNIHIEFGLPHVGNKIGWVSSRMGCEDDIVP